MRFAALAPHGSFLSTRMNFSTARLVRSRKPSSRHPRLFVALRFITCTRPPGADINSIAEHKSFLKLLFARTRWRRWERVTTASRGPERWRRTSASFTCPGARMNNSPASCATVRRPWKRRICRSQLATTGAPAEHLGTEGCRNIGQNSKPETFLNSVGPQSDTSRL